MSVDLRDIPFHPLSKEEEYKAERERELHVFARLIEIWMEPRNVQSPNFHGCIGNHESFGGAILTAYDSLNENKDS